MKVLVLATNYPTRSAPNNGIFNHRQTRALVELGVDCRVIQPVDGSPPAPLHLLHEGWVRARSAARDMLDEVDGIPVLHPRVPQRKPSRFFRGDYWESVGRATARFIAARPDLRDADLLYAHFLCHEGYAGWVASRELGLPLATIARGDDVHRWPELWPDRKEKLALVLRDAELPLACCKALARDAEAFATLGLGRPIEAVYDGVDAERFRPGDEDRRAACRRRLGLPARGRLLLTVATPLESKGWLDLLDAFADLAPSHGDWSLVGSGEPRSSGGLDLEREAQRRGMGDRFLWRGRTDPADMPDLQRACDGFVLASHNEGLSLSVLEALATGLPVVATRVGGHAEMIEHGVSGLLSAPGDVPALRSNLAAMLELDPSARRSMGTGARAAALLLGTPEANAARLRDLFEGVMASRSPSQ